VKMAVTMGTGEHQRSCARSVIRHLQHQQSSPRAYRYVASREGLVLAVLQPPVRGVGDDALAAREGLTLGAVHKALALGH
jgi:hypothetical protein